MGSILKFLQRTVTFSIAKRQNSTEEGRTMNLLGVTIKRQLPAPEDEDMLRLLDRFKDCVAATVTENKQLRGMNKKQAELIARLEAKLKSEALKRAGSLLVAASVVSEVLDLMIAS